MQKGFLVQGGKGTSRFGPLHDERSVTTASGWGGQSEVEDDPWVQRFQDVVIAHQQYVDTNTYRNMDENPYRNIPNLPYKTSAEPMNALGCYYSQYYHTTHMKMSDYYLTWNDENPKSHLLLWTSIFICPLSGELFMSGKWPGNDVVFKEIPAPIVTTDLTEHNDDNDNLTTLPLEGSIATTPPTPTTPNNDHGQRDG